MLVGLGFEEGAKHLAVLSYWCPLLTSLAGVPSSLASCFFPIISRDAWKGTDRHVTGRKSIGKEINIIAASR